jgi:RNA polymerase sigma-70 factor (ECF subfamily)
MDAEGSFLELIARVRAGDEQAAAELVRRYEPEIRRAVRVRLTDPRLRRVLDSVDICQSVLGNFFQRAADGQFEMEKPEQVLHLLLTMARNKLLDKVREQQAECRDVRRMQPADSDIIGEVPGTDETPSRILANRELLEQIHSHMSAEDRYLAEQRALGRDWADLAAECGKSPDALRKQLARTMSRVAKQMGLDESTEG